MPTIAIQIGTEFLDLPPDLEMEMQQENIFLQFDQSIIAEYSLPFEVAATEKNLRLLNYAAYMERRVDSTGIDAIVYDSGLPLLTGKIKIEKPSVNLNRMSDGRISCYFLSGGSSFWQDIKEIKMRDVDYDGTRSYAWDSYGFDLSEPNPGFWCHVRKVMYASPGYGVSGYDYAFFPVKNTSWPGNGTGTDLMNKVYWNEPTSAEFFIPSYLGGASDNERNRIVPFPYLKYVLIKVVEHCGWKLKESDFMQLLDFKKIVMLNFRAIDWCFLKRQSGDWVNVFRDPVEFDLADHLPDIKISEFLIALKNRFGWWYDFDKATKTITIREFNEVAAGEVKDFTEKADPLIPKPIQQNNKIYALKNSFSTNIEQGAPNFDVVALQGEVNELTDLPTAAEGLYGYVYLVIAENNYWICLQNEGTEAWEWQLYTYNVFDYEPAGYTDEITTAATTVGNEKYDDYLDFIPRADFQGFWFGKTEEDVDSGIILLFNHGVLANKNGDLYPYASHHNYSSGFLNTSLWSLSFKAFEAGTTNTEVGLYDRNWKKLLDLLRSQEEADVTLYLNRVEYENLKFSDQIVIRNTKWFIKTKKPKIPYKGKVELRLVRI